MCLSFFCDFSVALKPDNKKQRWQLQIEGDKVTTEVKDKEADLFVHETAGMGGHKGQWCHAKTTVLSQDT